MTGANSATTSNLEPSVGRGHQLDALLRQPEERKPPVRQVDVSTSHAVDDPPWHAAKRWDLPDVPLDGS